MISYSKKWQIAQEVSKDFQDRFPEINPLVLQMLYNRGLKTQDEIDEFLNPDYGQDLHDPFLFRDMKKAVKLIFKALEKGERIVVHGDYDADGVTSACLLVLTLREIEHRKTQTENTEKYRIDVYIPHRAMEGYGLNRQSVEQIAKKGTKLIITVDSGISNFEEIELANKLGMDVIITDHHHEPPKLPKAFAIINPQIAKEKYPFKDLAGVGVAFKLAQALLSANSQQSTVNNNQAFEKWLLDLVAVGTVADVMPLLGENRTLVKYGLIVLNKTRRIGLQELIKVSGLKSTTNFQPLSNPQSPIPNLSAWNIGFQLGPRINAAGRLDHANKAYQLLITEDRGEAKKIAEELNETNQGRQEMVKRIVEEVKIQIGEVTPDQKILFAMDPVIYSPRSEDRGLSVMRSEDRGLSVMKSEDRGLSVMKSEDRGLSVMKSEDRGLSIMVSPGSSPASLPSGKLGTPGWPMGIIGLIAGQLCDEFYRPALVITKNGENLKASGRSIPEFNLIEAIEEAGEYLSRFGGHPGAAGFSIDPKNLDKFKEKMEEIAQKKLANLDLAPSYFVEKKVNLEEINWDFYENLEKFTPFGQANPQPKFVARDLIVIGLETVGQNGRHLRIVVRDNPLTPLKQPPLSPFNKEELGEDNPLNPPLIRGNILNPPLIRGNILNPPLIRGNILNPPLIRGNIRKMIFFGGGEEWSEKLKMGDKIDCLFEVSANQWNGRRELQMKVVDLKLHN
jgi:single-stranded DNA-specific DHH superfamily exonuclease